MFHLLRTLFSWVISNFGENWPRKRAEQSKHINKTIYTKWRRYKKKVLSKNFTKFSLARHLWKEMQFTNLHVTCHMSCVTCPIFFLFFLFFLFHKVVKLSGEGLLSMGPTPSSFHTLQYMNKLITKVLVEQPRSVNR